MIERAEQKRETETQRIDTHQNNDAKVSKLEGSQKSERRNTCYKDHAIRDMAINIRYRSI